MNNMKTKLMLMGTVLLAAAALCGRAEANAGTPSYLNIDVTITASKSVSVFASGTNSSTDTSTSFSGTPNQVSTAATGVGVYNDSGVLSELWKLSTNASSLTSTSGGQVWSLATATTTVGNEAFAVQAVFGSSNTAATCGNASWSNGLIAPILPTTPATYTANGEFADSALNATGGLFNPDSSNTMLAYNAGMTNGLGFRKLCWRVILPATTAAVNGQIENIQVIVTAQ